MKLTNIANKVLKFMITEYSKKNIKSFDWDTLKNVIPNEPQLLDALSLLSTDELIEVFYADDIPYLVTINMTTIRNAEHNTILLKTYKFLKEFRDWF